MNNWLFVYLKQLFVDSEFQSSIFRNNLVLTSKTKTFFMELIKLFTLFFLVAVVLCHC